MGHTMCHVKTPEGFKLYIISIVKDLLKCLRLNDGRNSFVKSSVVSAYNWGKKYCGQCLQPGVKSTVVSAYNLG